jgi:hypothetical protein
MHQSSSASAFGGEASVAGGPAGATASVKGGAAAAAAVVAAGDGPRPDDALRRLRGLAQALEMVDAALVQNAYLPQLLLYRCAQGACPLGCRLNFGQRHTGWPWPWPWRLRHPARAPPNRLAFALAGTSTP